jgi:hypothetical protein
MHPVVYNSLKEYDLGQCTQQVQMTQRLHHRNCIYTLLKPDTSQPYMYNMRRICGTVNSAFTRLIGIFLKQQHELESCRKISTRNSPRHHINIITRKHHHTLRYVAVTKMYDVQYWLLLAILTKYFNFNFTSFNSIYCLFNSIFVSSFNYFKYQSALLGQPYEPIV